MRTLNMVPALVFLAFLSSTAFAAHPLITDDTGTQGKGRFQVEVNGQYDHDQGDGVETESTQAAITLSYGAGETLDIVLGLPFQFMKVKDAETTNKAEGVSDVSIEAKWRFYDKDGISFALKPGITLPTGDEGRGLGAGSMTYRLFLIGTKEIKPWTFHLNLGYIRNENKIDEKKDVWHTSLAAIADIVEHIKLVGNIGIESNPDRTSHTHPAFILGGIIFSFSKNVDMDLGVKGALNKPETDYSVLAGITLRF